MRSLLSSYTNLVEIGRGGMATVYRATSAANGHLVAIKVLDMHLVNDPTARARFAQEASFQLAHPNIVRVIEHDVDARGSTPYIVMEYVAGESLEQRLQREGKQTPKTLMPVLKDIGNALDYAHSQGVIHRDVKPNNILIRAKSGQALLADFGIAKTASFTAYTATMARVGSVLFMSPEQAAGEPLLSPSSDIYSLGVTAYYALSGRHPFEGEDQVAIARRHIDEMPAHPSDVDPNVPRALGDVVMRTLSKQPMQRPGSAGEFVQQMEKAFLAPAQPAINPANGVLHGAEAMPRGSGVIPQAPAQPSNAAPRMSDRIEPTFGRPSIFRGRLILGALGILILGLLCALLALLWPNTQNNGTQAGGAQGNGTATSQAATSQASAGTASATSTGDGAQATNAVGTPGTTEPGAGTTSIPNPPTANATSLTPNVIVAQTATPPPTTIVIVSSVVVASTLPPYIPEPTSTRVPQFPVIIPTATQPLLYPPTAAPPTNTPPPPSATPIAPTPLPTASLTPSPTTFSSPIATPTLFILLAVTP